MGKRCLVEIRPSLKFLLLPFFSSILLEIDIEITTDKESYKPGTDMSGEIKIHNSCNDTRSMTMFWRVFIVRYDGVVIKQIKKEKHKVTVKANESKFVEERDNLCSFQIFTEN